MHVSVCLEELKRLHKSAVTRSKHQVHKSASCHLPVFNSLARASFVACAQATSRISELVQTGVEGLCEGLFAQTGCQFEGHAKAGVAHQPSRARKTDPSEDMFSQVQDV